MLSEDSSGLLPEILREVIEVKGTVGELTGEVKGINRRLDTLNGTVARHEGDLGKLKASAGLAVALRAFLANRRAVKLAMGAVLVVGLTLAGATPGAIAGFLSQLLSAPPP